MGLIKTAMMTGGAMLVVNQGVKAYNAAEDRRAGMNPNQQHNNNGGRRSVSPGSAGNYQTRDATTGRVYEHLSYCNGQCQGQCNPQQQQHQQQQQQLSSSYYANEHGQGQRALEGENAAGYATPPSYERSASRNGSANGNGNGMQDLMGHVVGGLMKK